MKKLVSLFVIISAVFATSAAFAKTNATLVPSCNPCEVGSVVTFTGAGYKEGYVGLTDGTAHGPTYADANGNLVPTGWKLSTTGEYTFTTYQFTGAKQQVKATVTLLVN